MFLLAPATTEYRPVSAYLTLDTLTYLVSGVIFAFAPFERVFRLRFDRVGVLATQLGLSSISLVYSLLLLAVNSYNPFIYFRF
jgi:hypothetical protein